MADDALDGVAEQQQDARVGQQVVRALGCQGMEKVPSGGDDCFVVCNGGLPWCGFGLHVDFVFDLALLVPGQGCTAVTQRDVAGGRQRKLCKVLLRSGVVLHKPVCDAL